jgi:hypothetical protein
MVVVALYQTENLAAILKPEGVEVLRPLKDFIDNLQLKRAPVIVDDIIRS